MLVIPAIDLLGGRCVRLTQGRYDKETEYSRQPAEVAREWVKQGAQRLHIVDLDGAKEGRPVNIETLRGIASVADVPVQFGGGIRNAGHLEEVFAAGASRAILGTRALTDRGFLINALSEYGERVIVSVDVRGNKVMLQGWLEDSGMDFEATVRDLYGAGLREIIVTDVSRDGTLEGLDPSLIQTAASAGMGVIAAGGVGSLDDIRLLGQIPGVKGVIVGKALYAGRFSLAEALAEALNT